MTLSWPSFLASAISAFMPPAACADVTVAQLTEAAPPPEPAAAELEAELAPVVASELDELDEQAAVSSAVLAIAAPAAITYRARKVFLPGHCWLDKSRACLGKVNGWCQREDRQTAVAGQFAVSGNEKV